VSETPRTEVLPGLIRKRLIDECERAENPMGMSVHDGKTRAAAADIRYVLAWVDHLEGEHAALRAELEAVRGERPAFERELSDLTDKTCAQTRLIQDLAMMCRRMSYALNRNRVEDTLVRQCIDLLKKHDLGGQVIRTHAAREEGQG